MNEVVGAFFDRHPGLELWALGSRIHHSAIDRQPYGLPVRFVASEHHADAVRSYLALNRLAFSNDLRLPGWVLTDLYLVPGIVGLMVSPLDGLPLQWPITPIEEGRGPIAAYYASASLQPGMFVGVSLISAVAGMGMGPMVKALTLRMNRANRVRGVSGWEARPIRAHAKLGPMRLVSRTPGPHERATRSFVYETVLDDEAQLSAALSGRLEIAPAERVHLSDQDGFGRLLDRVERGERLAIVPPGVDGEGYVCLAQIGFWV